MLFWRDIKICYELGAFWKFLNKRIAFWGVKNSVFGQEVHYYMVYIAYFIFHISYFIFHIAYCIFHIFLDKGFSKGGGLTFGKNSQIILFFSDSVPKVLKFLSTFFFSIPPA